MSEELKTAESPVTEQLTSDAVVQTAPAATTTLDIQTLMNELPEDLKSDPSLANVKDTTTLVKNYINAQRMIGNSIRIPRQDDPQELKDAFYTKLKDVPGLVKLPTQGNKAEQDALFSALGRPMTAEGYKIEAPKDLPVSEDISKAFKGLAYNIGLSQNQVKAISDFQFSLEGELMKQNQAQVAATKEILSQEWGKEYDNRINAVKELINTYASKYPEQAESLINSQIANNPVVMLMAAELAKTYKEKGLITEKSPLQWGLTPDEAHEKISEVRGNPELMKAYLDDRHPNHKAVVEKMQQYYSARHSE